MRGYFTTTIAAADAIFRHGFRDRHEFAGLAGVWVTDRPGGRDERFAGPVTLYQDVPDDEYRRYEVVEDGGGPGYRLSLIPAAALNRLGKPAVYDHAFAGCSRRELLRARGDEAASRAVGDAVAKPRRVDR
jgi:hypothetical protein